jgi:hypothetical protein
MDAEVGAGVGPQLRPELLQGRRDRAVLGHCGRRHHGAEQPVPGRADAKPPVGLADLVHRRGQLVRRRCHLHLTVDPFVRGGVAGESDAELPAHQAASAVAADQPACAFLCAVGKHDAYTVPVLLEACHLAAAADLRTEFDGALRQQAVGDRLLDAEDVAVCGVQVHRQGFLDPREASDPRVLLPLCEEPVQQAALVHDLDAARVQAERADRVGRLSVLLQHEHVHAVQPQLAGQHHPRRPATANDHVKHVKPQSKI